MLRRGVAVAVLVAAVLTASQAANARRKNRLVPIVHRAWACKDVVHYFVIHNYTKLLDERGGEYLTLDVELLKSMKSFTKMEVLVHRCSEVAGGCEYFTTWHWTTALCPLVMAKGVVWSPMIQQISPRVTCPFQAGRYFSANGTVDMDVLDSLRVPGLENNFWQIESKMFDGKEVSSCLRFRGEVRRVKSRA
ncbi:hypothetical protein ONE63_002315 [Megalurothrips usitatus]|uniref:Uncharacterized protein n=1 Tax=Megalurothrips usitatus TaxID=439358 RepID=A0AAV7XCA4_9NEOP|nr:hypothetical protein ONE63_002315 [Megalurothrips usitatus]